jgi:hypothetical protein
MSNAELLVRKKWAKNAIKQLRLKSPLDQRRSQGACSSRARTSQTKSTKFRSASEIVENFGGYPRRLPVHRALSRSRPPRPGALHRLVSASRDRASRRRAEILQSRRQGSSMERRESWIQSSSEPSRYWIQCPFLFSNKHRWRYGVPKLSEKVVFGQNWHYCCFENATGCPDPPVFCGCIGPFWKSRQFSRPLRF